MSRSPSRAAQTSPSSGTPTQRALLRAIPILLLVSGVKAVVAAGALAEDLLVTILASSLRRAGQHSAYFQQMKHFRRRQRAFITSVKLSFLRTTPCGGALALRLPIAGWRARPSRQMICQQQAP